ncbi:hypothetical protein GSI_08678 [Ganoderma sinense ZZ0214-1]|uniref:Uncharacterized protein n=1 Tax=Ganoderma sinense ZZ0214-1 TaxID=1077348 RepID=A0A2G8S4D2_9APHY|nr:hypothetical protein GSI_08678 [Ganoderma sinense ZZ0214-1]
MHLMDLAPSYLRTDQPIPPRLADVSGSDASPRSSLPFPDDGVVMGFPTASRGGLPPTWAGGAGTLPIPPVTSTNRRTLSIFRTSAWTLAFVLFAASSAPTMAGAATITLNTTTISECVQTLLTWTGGSAPYKLKISPIKADGNPDTSQMQQYSGIQTASYAWTTNFTAGTQVQFDITDADGDSSGGPDLTVATGNTNCLSGVSGSSLGTDGASATGTASGGSPGSTASGSPSPNAVTVSRTGLSGGAIAGIAVGVGVMAVLATTLILWCLLKRFLLKHGRHRHRNPSRAHSGTGTDTPSSSSSADEVRVSWYQRAARRMSLRGHGFDIDRPVARSPTFSDSARSDLTSQRGPLLPVSAYNGISSTLEGTGGAAADPFRAPTPTDSVIVSGPSSPVSDRGEASFRSPSHLQPSTTSLSDTQSQTKKPRRPAHAHNTSDTSTRSASHSDEQPCTDYVALALV